MNKYPGQKGHNLNKCASFDEKNTAQLLCKLNTVAPKPEQIPTAYYPSKEYQTIPTSQPYVTHDTPVSDRIVSCQNIAPSYYPDMTQSMIGKRPVYSARNCEYNIPAIIVKNTDNFSGKCFDGMQPNWAWACM